MRDFFSFCFEYLTDPLSLPLNPITEYIILALLDWIARKLAYGLVGNMYGTNLISGGTSGSLFHWIFRGIIFVTIWWTANAVITIYRFVAEHWLILLTTLGAILLLAVFFLVRHFAMQNRLKPVKETVQKS